MIVIRNLMLSIIRNNRKVGILLAFFLFCSIIVPITYNAIAEQASQLIGASEDDALLFDENDQVQARSSGFSRILPAGTEVVFTFAQLKTALENKTTTTIHFGADISLETGGAIINPNKAFLVIDGTNPYGIAPNLAQLSLPSPSPSETPEIVEITPTPNPELIQEPTPTPNPELISTPEPEPTPTPNPELIPTPEPDPTPTPNPELIPTPEPDPTPTPNSELIPDPTPTPNPELIPTPEPEPTPTPNPELIPTPEPQAQDTPVPTQNPELIPTPEPPAQDEQEPEPTPTLNPELVETPEPTPTPNPELIQTQEPNPTPNPDLLETPEPTLTQNPELQETPEQTPEVTQSPEQTIEPSLTPDPEKETLFQSMSDPMDQDYYASTVHTFTDIVSTTVDNGIRLNANGTLKNITVQNINWKSKTDWGTICVYLTVLGVNQIYDNVTFTGTALAYNRGGSVLLRDVNMYRQPEPPFEAAPAAFTSEIRVEGTCNLIDMQTHTGSYPMFYIIGTAGATGSGSVTIARDAKLKCEVKSPVSEFYEIPATGVFLVDEGAHVDFKGTRALNTGAVPRGFVVYKNAIVNISLSEDNQYNTIIYVGSTGVVIGENAVLNIDAPNSSSNEFIRIVYGWLVVQKNATLHAISKMPRVYSIVNLYGSGIKIEDPKSVVLSSNNTAAIRVEVNNPSTGIDIDAEQINVWTTQGTGVAGNLPKYSWKKANGENISLSAKPTNTTGAVTVSSVNYLLSEDISPPFNELSTSVAEMNSTTLNLANMRTLSVGKTPALTAKFTSKPSLNEARFFGTTDPGAKIEIWQKPDRLTLPYTKTGETYANDGTYSVSTANSVNWIDPYRNRVISFIPYFASQLNPDVPEVLTPVTITPIRVGSEETIGTQTTVDELLGQLESVVYPAIDSYKPLYYKIQGDNTEYPLTNKFIVAANMQIKVYYASTDISVEVPTQILFAAFESGSGVVTSPNYLIKNSSDLPIKVDLQELKYTNTLGVSILPNAQNNGELQLELKKVDVFQNSVLAINPNVNLGANGSLGHLDGATGQVANRTGSFSIGGKYVGPFSVSKQPRVDFVFKLSIDE